MHYSGLATATPSRKLDGYFGVTPEIQQRVGAFILIWGMFEVASEPLIWLLRNENPVGEKAITDGKPISEWLKILDEASFSHGGYVRDAVKLICGTATDLLVYRNAIIHGRLSASSNGPFLISNNPWIGEKKKKPVRLAVITKTELDAAAGVAETLFRSTFGFMAAGLATDNYDEQSLLKMLHELEAAREHAKRLRVIAEEAEDA
jgi:hypothetical protein